MDVAGRVAVVTGGASGIGYSLARRLAREGARIVLADLDEDRVVAAAETLVDKGASAIGVRIDVSRESEVERLAELALATYGAVHIVCNNAGVIQSKRIWETSVAEWEWLLGVNLYGVIHGMRVFVPLLLEQARAHGAAGHIINTASIAGLLTGPGLGAYKSSKHAVVALSEVLYHELAETGAPIGVTVLCPSWVRTPLFDTAAESLARTARLSAHEASRDAAEERLRGLAEAGSDPDDIAEQALAAIRENRFYVLTHPERTSQIEMRFDDILQGHNPRNPMTGSRAASGVPRSDP